MSHLLIFDFLKGLTLNGLIPRRVHPLFALGKPTIKYSHLARRQSACKKLSVNSNDSFMPVINDMDMRFVMLLRIKVAHIDDHRSNPAKNPHISPLFAIIIP